ncbi:VanZ family protein [Cohnella ginsengisoli]|uniref:VanZ family protein n=1 Tax=Cohnella ginsengisoli TaxID=425004 RepID=A0A9X4KEP3_9BACL|nr:VanZ family protein [Cohnella ginsengisoli]MDG0790769.1 VanZ family protein [Cohnella ginsengisoli]
MSRFKAVRFAQALPAVACLALIFFFSSQTYDEQTIIPLLQRHISEFRLSALLPDVSFRYGHSLVSAKQAPYQFIEFLFRKSAHVFWYASLCASLYLALKSLPRLAPSALHRLGAAAALMSAAACVDEWNQARVAGRTGQPIDVLLDVGGGLLVTAILLAIVGAIKAARRGAGSSPL